MPAKAGREAEKRMGERYELTVNGVTRTVEEDKPLLRYLRDDLRLTSVKDGCSEGACGTCTVLVDGRAMRACILTTKKAAGKSIVTVEGLTPAEQEAFVYAFGAVGAVQCGFCIPGMVLSGKALLDQNPNPTEAEIKKAIRGNICRCTGYKKIIEGIALAGAILRGERSIDPTLEQGASFGQLSVVTCFITPRMLKRLVSFCAAASARYAMRAFSSPVS